MADVLYAWRADRLVGKVLLGAGAARAEGAPELVAAVAELGREPYLPLTVREEVQGRRYVRCERLAPGEPGYWAALAEALERRLELTVTTTEAPPPTL